MERYLRAFLFVPFILFSFLSKGQTLYWVGGSGDWNDASHWATQSGGKGGSGVPDSTTDVIFDHNSFTQAKETIRIQKSAFCRDLHAQTPTYKELSFKGGKQVKLEVHGSVDLFALSTFRIGKLHFTSDQENSIRAQGTILETDLTFQGKGSWTVQGDVWTEKEDSISLLKGDLKIPSGHLRTGTFLTEGANKERRLHIGQDAALQIQRGVHFLDTASFHIDYSGTPINIDKDVPSKRVHLQGTPSSVGGMRGTNSATSCNSGGCINEVKVIPKDTAVKNGYDVSCSNSCDGRFILRITDSSGCASDDHFSYKFFINGSYKKDDSLVWEVCSQDKFTARVINDSTGQFCQVTYELDIPNELTDFSKSKTQPSCPNACDGEIYYNPTGGVTPYDFQWNNGDTTDTADSLCAGNNHQVLVTDANGCELKDTLTLDDPPDIVPNLQTEDASCYGVCDGTAKVDPSGGNGSPYYYSWSTGATTDSIGGLCAGNYSVTVYDKDSCTKTVNFTIGQPAQIQISLDSIQDLLCYDQCIGSISVSVSQGTPPYSYEWFDANTGNAISPQQDTSEPTGLCAGDYYVKVTDSKGCQETSSTYTITQPDSLDHDTASTNVLCSGDCNGTATLDTVFGGTTPYSYEWYDSTGTAIGQTDSTATGLCPGDYYAVITDSNGCQLESDTMTVDAPPALTLDTSKKDILCHGNCTGEASVSVSGGTSPYNIEWYDDTTDNSIGITDDTAKGLCQGDYYAVVTDANNCVDTTEVITVDQPPELTTSISSQDVTCNGACDGLATVSVSGGVTPHTIDWYDGSGSSIGQSGDTASGLCPGDYYAIVEDDHGCKDTTDTTTITQPAPLSVSLDVTHITCGGDCDGSITANVSGGTPSYDYQWYDANSGTPLGTNKTQDNLCPGDYYVEVTDSNGCTITSPDSTVTEPAPLTLSVDSQNVSCHDTCDGKAFANVSGGTPPYTYNWTDGSGNPIAVNDDTLEGLCPDTYSVSVTDDNGCSIGPENTQVEDPAPIDPGLSTEDPSCFGDCNGTAAVNVSGGTPGYSYLWSTGSTSDSISGLCDGNYWVEITDANGCDSTVNFSLNAPPDLSISVSTDSASCNGDCDGSATVSISGGTPSYDIQWLDQSGNPIPGETDTTITGLCAGTYGVEVTDSNGCGESSSNVTIGEPDPLSISLNVSDVTCNGDCDGSITANVSGGTTPYSYQWYNSSGFPLGSGQTINNLCPGDYYVEVTDDEGCTQTSNTVTVTQPPALSLSTSGQDISCYGACDGMAVADVSGGTPPYDYNWTDSGGNPVGGNNDTIKNLCPETYSVNVVDDNGCTIGPGSVTIEQPDSLEATLSKTNASCNSTCDGRAEVSVTGGTTPYSFSWSTGATDSIETGLCPGNYSVTVTDVNGCDTTINFTITDPPSLSFSLTTSDPTCSGVCDGSGSISISGGTSPYDIQWYDGAGNPIPGDTTTSVSGYCEGNYSVEVVDANGCNTSQSFTLDAPQPMTLTIDSTQDASCGSVCDGKAWISVSGGSTPYTYDWINATTGNSTGITKEDPDSLCSGNYVVEVTDDQGCIITSDTITINEAVLITGNTGHEDASCFGYCDGSAWVTPSGGTSPYSYTWINTGTGDTIGATDSISGLCADTFAVTITDDIGCSSAPIIVEVGEASLLTLDTDSTPVSCSGGSDGEAIVTPSGGTKPYSYQWDASTGNQTDSIADSLAAGTYSVTVTDSQGCSTDTSVTVTEPSPVSAGLDLEDASCNGSCDGMAWVDPSGGNPGYAVQWYDSGGNPIAGATNDTLDTLCAGSYSVTVTDTKGCKDSVAFSINEPAPVSVSIGSKSDLSCNGSDDGSATATVSGGSSPYSYQWNDPAGQTSATASGLAPGTYTVTVTDAEGCQGSAQVTINEPAPLSFDLDSLDVSCNGDCDGMAYVDNLSGGTPPYSIEWDDPLTQTGDTAIQLCAGAYTATITDANGCDTSGTVTVEEPPAIDIALDSVVHPSCAGSCDGSISITTSGGTGSHSFLWIDTNSGDTVSTSEDPTGLCDGSYEVTVSDANGCEQDTVIDVIEPAAMTASFTTQNASCGSCDGWAKIDVQNASAPVSYSWSPAPGGGSGTDSAYGLCPDVYTVDVTDADGCTQQFSVSISNIGAEETETDSTLVTCEGDCDGTASVTIVGGCSDPSCSVEWLDSTGSSIGQTGPNASGLCKGLYYAEVTNGSGCITLDPVEINSPGNIIPNLSTTDASCGGTCDGEASVSPSGGTPPYSYSWSSGTTPSDSMTGGLCAGTHSVTVSDANNCDTTISFTIDEPPTLVIDTTDSTAVSCNGGSDGSATVYPAGGTPGYVYEWYDCATGNPIGQSTQQATGLSAGSYYAVVTDINGCTVISSCITVPEPSPLDATASAIQHVDCNGADNGIAEVDGSGGNTPYSYEWRNSNGNVVGTGNDTAYNLEPDTYAAEVIDANGCTAIDSVTIDEPSPLSASSTSSPATCNGSCDGEIQVSVSGGVIPYDYQWYDENGNLMPGDTSSTLVDCAGIYTVEITDGNGCMTTLTDTIQEPSSLNLSVSTSSGKCNGSCDGSASVSASGGNGGPYSYQWLDSLQNPIAGETSSSLDSACEGTYYVVVSDQIGCSDTAQAIVDEPDSLLATTSSNNSTCGDCNGSASVTPTGGISPYSYQWDANAGNQTTQTATGLCAGVYSVTVTDANGCSGTFTATVSDQGAENLSTDSVDESCYGACDGKAIVDYSCSIPPCTTEWYDASTGNPIGQTGDTATGLCQGTYYAEVTNGDTCVAVATVNIDGPAPLEANASVNDVSCSGSCDGSISVSPSGGSTPYSYSWTDSTGTVIGTGSSISNLCPGPYSVLITDANGCDTSYTFTVDEPAFLSANLDSSNVLCSGDCNGSAVVTPNGGTTPYSYQWYDGGGTALSGETDSLIDSLCAGNYSVKVSDSSGCDTTLDVTIEEPAPIQPDLVHDDLLCNGDCNGSAAVDPTGGSGSYDYQWYNSSGVAIPGETDSNISNLCQGSYSISILDSNGCSVWDTAVIDEPAPLTISIDSVRDPSCNGNCDGMISVTASGGSAGPSGYSYQWYDGSGNPLPNSDTTFKDNLCGGSYSIEVTDTSGCTTARDTFLVEPSPITTNLSTNDADCGVSNGSASVSGTSGGTAPYSYQWYDNAMNPIGTGSLITGLPSGSYNLKITDDKGCTASFGFTISDINAPNVTTDSVEPVTCSGGQDGAIYISVSGGASPYDYLWNPSGSMAQDLIDREAGIYTVEVTDSNGCTRYYEDTIPSPSPMMANFDTVSATCGNCDGEASVNVSGGNPSYSYQWSTGSTTDSASGLCPGVHSVEVTDSTGCQETFDVAISDIGGPTVDNVIENPVTCNGDCDGSGSVSVSGGATPYDYYWVHDGTDSSWHGGLCAGTYFVQIEDSLGCVTTATVNIPEPAPLTDSANIYPASCGACDGTIDLHIDGGTPPYTYNWSNGSSNSTINNLCEGTYSVTVTDNNGCSQTFTYSVPGKNAPLLSASAIDVKCAGQCDGKAYADVSNDSTVVLDWLDGSGNPIGQSGDTASGLCPGQYTVRAEDTSSGCLDFATVQVEEADSLQFNLPNVKDVTCNGACDGEATVSFTGGTYPYNVQWDPSGETGTQASGLCQGTHTVEVTDKNGCVDSQEVIIDGPTPLVMSVDSTEQPLCETSGTGAIYISVSGGSAPYSYDWNGPGGFVATTQDIDSLNAGTYIVEVEDDKGCTTKDTIQIDPSVPVNAEGGPDTSVCSGDSLQLIGTGSATNSEWLDPSGDQVSSGDSLNVVINGSGSFRYVAYNGSCSDTDTVAISINSEPTADAGQDATIIVDEKHELGGSPTGPSGAGIVWDPTKWMKGDSSASNPTIQPEEPGEYSYTVTVTSPEGCVAIDSVLIEVKPDLEFPDGFSPNGDGVNDVWEIDRIDEYPKATVDVFNRWGERLFHSQGYEEPWDGTYNGKPVPVGTYYYVIDLNDPEAVKQKYTGPITIVR